MNLTEDQILQLAPDEASRKAGIGLSGTSKWVSKGMNEVALWGECQGSGSKPYQTQIDMANIAFKCSCPSRKFPCKHGLGLLLLYTRKPAAFTSSGMPAWVEEWMSKRAGKEEKKTDKAEKKVDEAAQVKRQESREKKVAGGMDDLLLWIKDIVRSGLMTLPGRQPDFPEQMAKRMVDAQAGGLAALLKEFGKINFYAEGWQSECMDQLLNLYLIVHAHKNIGSLPVALQQDVRSWIGFTQNQDELKEQPGVEDAWLVLGKQVQQDDQLTVERYWLHGAASGRYALILQFVARNQVGGSLSLTPGMYLQAELVYYPSVMPLRALVKKLAPVKPAPVHTKVSGWKEVLKQEAGIYAQLPFMYSRPYIVQQVTPVLYDRRWWLQDQHNELAEISPGFTNIWKLLAISGGRPLDTALVGKETTYEPMGVWQNNIYQSL